MEESIEYKLPHVINFSRIGEPSLGYISVSQYANQYFDVKRVFWTYYTPENIIRGRHAHYKTEQILVAVAGRIIVNTESADGTLRSFILDAPDKGVYIPPNVWHTMQYSHSSVQMVIANTEYNESDYIREFEEFKQVWK